MPLLLTDERWHPVDHGALPYALAAMRTLWVWPLLHLGAASLAPGRGDWLAWPTILTLLALSTLVSQVASFRVRSIRRGALLVACCGLVAVGAALYLDLALGRLAPWDPRWVAAIADGYLGAIPTLVVAVWLWWWGTLSGRQSLHYGIYAGNFALGASGLGLAAIIIYQTGVLSLTTMLGPVLAFFAIGLATLAISSLRSTRQYERNDATFRVSRYWLGTVAGVIALLLSAGLLLAQLFSPEVIRKLVSMLSVAADYLARLLYWVIVAFSWIAFTVLGVIGRLVRLRPGTADISLQLQPPLSLADQFQELDTPPVGLSPAAYSTLRVVAGVLIVGFILLVFALAFRRFRTYFEEDVEEVRESVLSADLLKAQLAALFRRKAQTPKPPAFALVEGDDPRAKIRRIYQALLAWASQRGLARPPGMTPEEYLTLVSQTMPDHKTSLAVITASYLQARYSPDPIPEAVAARTADAWEAIEHLAPGT